MKKSIIFLLLLFATVCLKAQSLKERGLKGNVKEIIEITKDGLLSIASGKPVKSVTSFDKQGYITSDKEYLSDGSLPKRSEYIKSGNNEISMSEYNKHNNLLLKIIYSLNDRHQVAEIIMEMFDDPDKPDPVLKLLQNKKFPPYKTVYKYDQAGNRIEEDNYLGNVVHSKKFYTYDKANRKIKEEMVNMRSGKTEFSDTYSYDTATNTINYKGFDAISGKTSTDLTIYGKLDKQGNWLTEEHKSPDFNYKKERTIKYY